MTVSPGPKRAIPSPPRPRRPDEPNSLATRRISRQLTVLTAGLICALLVVLILVTYFTTQSVLTESLHDTLRNQVNNELTQIEAAIARHHRGQPYSTEPFDDQESGGVFVVFSDPNLSGIGGSGGPFGRHFADPGAARRALAERRSLFGVRRSPRGHDYEIYTRPIVDNGELIGVVQAGVSRREFEENLSALVRVLILVGGLGLVAAVLISGVLVRRALLPIRMSLQRQRDFVADAAHELRTPLAIIRSSAELSLSEGTDEEYETALEQNLVQANHLSRLVDDLSLLARADSGGLSLDRRQVDLGRLVEETVSGIEVLAEENGQMLRSEAPEPVFVVADESRLRQVLMILLDNALKHTPEGGTITVRVERNRDRAVLQVRDTGPGIDPQDLPHIFDRFYRADRARTSQGAGLGLAIARSIVAAHHGDIRAANAPEGGAVFTVSLPSSG